MTADLIFYNERYGGDTKIPAASFPLWERRAETLLLGLTAGRIEGKDDDSIKMCICEIAELIYEYGKVHGFQSENNDGYSVHYQNRDIKNEVIKIAETYLYGTDYLYRGIDNDG